MAVSQITLREVANDRSRVGNTTDTGAGNRGTGGIHGVVPGEFLQPAIPGFIGSELFSEAPPIADRPPALA